MSRTRMTLTRLLPATLLVMFASGCAVSSGRADYTAHTEHQVIPGGQPSANLAVAFGLDGNRTTTGTVAHVDPR